MPRRIGRTIADQGDAGTAAWLVSLAGSAVPLPTGAATEATLVTLATAAQLTSLLAKYPAALGVGGGIKVDGSGTALPISAASLPLPSGASTETTLASVLTQLAYSAGGGLPVDVVTSVVPVNGAKGDNGTNVSQKVPVLPCISNAAAPSDTEARLNPLSLDLAGQLRTKLPFTNRSDTFTTTSSGTTVDLTKFPLSVFSVAVKMTGTVTSWTVLLEGSLDNTNFTTLLTHTNAAPGDGLIQSLAAGQNTPVLYLRTRCSAITLGAGTNVIAVLVGVPA